MVDAERASLTKHTRQSFKDWLAADPRLRLTNYRK